MTINTSLVCHRISKSLEEKLNMNSITYNKPMLYAEIADAVMQEVEKMKKPEFAN